MVLQTMKVRPLRAGVDGLFMRMPQRVTVLHILQHSASIRVNICAPYFFLLY
jgi:hypothetical protein